MNTQQTNNEIESKVKKLLSEMTLEEKVGQMTQVDFSVIGVPQDQNADNPIDQARLEDAVLKHHVGSILNAPYTPHNKAQTIETWRKMMQTVQAVAAKSRLKIPLIFGIDAIHGATYTQNSVLFPQAINMAATFNPGLSFREGEITARELRASGLQWNFSPMMDIGRQLLWPRLWETYGEDVHLATVLGSSFIKGHQGDDFSAANKAPTCLKHYVGYSFPINGKDRTPAWIGERMLREYFLPTKTLAKLANFAAKKWKRSGGVLDLSDPVRREMLMKIVPVSEVWGIGTRFAARLNQLGIVTVWDLASQPTNKIQSQFNIVVARTVMELNGIPCLELEEIAPDKKQIVCSRSFSRRLSDYGELSQALAEFCSRAAEKLRSQHSVAGHISVFIRTSPFNPQEPQYQRSAGLILSSATQDTRIIVGAANHLLKEIFRAGYDYQKCGVQLSQLQPESSPSQMELFNFTDNGLPKENRLLMKVVDQINRHFPKAISVAATGFDKTWKVKTEHISQRYTTDWRELVSVKCG